MAKRTKQLTSQGEESEEIRINKFLSEAGVCSRREADRFIEEGKVQIDGVKAEMGSKVGKDSIVTFMGKPMKKEEKLVLIAFNKPEGIVCTTDNREPDNIIEFIGYGMRIYPIGRLDKDSEGLILLTNDGNIVNKILRAENYHEKEYIVTVNKEITQDFLKGMSKGVPILDTVTKPCEVSAVDRFTFRIILTQGLNRQIRRMCEHFDYHVTNLSRIRIMNINLGRLKTGNWRNVTEKEIEEMNRLIQTGNLKGSIKHKESDTVSTARLQTRARAGNSDRLQTKARAGNSDKLQTKARAGNSDRLQTRTRAGNSDRLQTKAKAGNSDRHRTKMTADNTDGFQVREKTGNNDRHQTKPKWSSREKSSQGMKTKSNESNRDILNLKARENGRDKLNPKTKEKSSVMPGRRHPMTSRYDRIKDR